MKGAAVLFFIKSNKKSNSGSVLITAPVLFLPDYAFFALTAGSGIDIINVSVKSD